MNLTTFRNSVSRKVGLSNTDGSAEQALIDQWVNEGVLEVLKRTRCYVTSAELSLTAGEGDYDMSADILLITSMFAESGGSRVPLTPVSEDEMHLLRAGDASGYPSRWAMAGANLLMVWPDPAAGDTITIYFVPKPSAALSSGSHDPSSTTYGGVPTEFHKAIEFYALWQAADYDDDTSSKVGLDYRSLFLEEISEAKRLINRKRPKLPRAVPNRSRRRDLGLRNDQVL